MLNKSTLALFVTTALAGFTAAFPHRRNIAPFTTIPLGKRNTLTRDDGTFDAEKAVHSAFMTKSKYEQNLLNFRCNMGVALPGEVRLYVLQFLVLIAFFFRMESTPLAMFHVRRKGTGLVQNSLQTTKMAQNGQGHFLSVLPVSFSSSTSTLDPPTSGSLRPRAIAPLVRININMTTLDQPRPSPNPDILLLDMTTALLWQETYMRTPCPLRGSK